MEEDTLKHAHSCRRRHISKVLDDTFRRLPQVSAGGQKDLGRSQTKVVFIIESKYEVSAHYTSHVHLVVSTSDAWAKWKAGFTKGVVGHSLSQLNVIATFVDEMQSAKLEQILAGCGTEENLQTLVFLGDENQHLEHRYPAYTRSPWTASAEAAEDAQEEHPADISSRVTRRAPMHRAVTQWLRGSSVCRMVLSQSQRCGPQVTRFLSQWLPFAQAYESADDAPQTILEHCYYTGSGWMSLQQRMDIEWQVGSAHSAPQERGTSSSDRSADALVGWHTTLYNSIVTQLNFDLAWLRSGNHGQPPIVILCYLRRVAEPLQALVTKLFSTDEVEVKILDSVRGLNADVAYILHHRRFVNSQDQFDGIQRDVNRWYVGYTRARRKLLVFLEGEGYWSTQPSGPAWKQHATAKARDMLLWNGWRNGTFGGVLALTENDSGWPAAYQACFNRQVPESWVSRVQDASAEVLTELWSTARSATVERGYAGVLDFLKELLANEAMRGWAAASSSELAAEGVGRAAAKYRVSLDDLAPPDTSNPKAMADAILFGCLVIPAVVTQLSEKPERGVTKICIPFCLESMARGAEPADNPLGREPMLEGFAVLLWHLLIGLHPEWGRQLDVKCIRHKAEVKEVVGQVWFTKACQSNRVASCLFEEGRKAGKRKRVYIYRGGGSLDSNNKTELASGIVVICKTWELAACVHVALWMAASCSPFTQEVWPNRENTLGAVPCAADNHSDSDDDDEEVGPGTETIIEGPADVVPFLNMCAAVRDQVLDMQELALWPTQDLQMLRSEDSKGPILSMDERLKVHMASASVLCYFQAAVAPSRPNEPP